MKKILTVLIGLVAALVLSTSPAQAKTHKECEEVSGEYGWATVCAYVNIKRVAGSNDLIVTRHSIRLTSSYSDSEMGYLNMHDIKFRGREVSSGIVRHADDNERTGSRLWAHEKNFRIRSGYGRFYFDFMVGWTGIGPLGWPDDHVTMSFTVD